MKMSFDVGWDINKYKEDHESEEHWLLRKAFMERWKNDYPEERLVCLARVFFNIEFMGCRYPIEIMKEVAALSHDVAQQYRNLKKQKLQRTFVSASDAAEDRAKGFIRKGGIIVDVPPQKSTRISFVRQGYTEPVTDKTSNEESNIENDESKVVDDNLNVSKDVINEKETTQDPHDYLKEMLNVKCINVQSFTEKMFNSPFGRMVLLIRPWTSKLGNILSSCQVCHVPLVNTFKDNCYSLLINGILVAQATGATKACAKATVEIIAWNRLREELVSVLIKELWIAQGDKISASDVSGRGQEARFGTPVENSVATKMMKLMGWKGGGLGADSQGIAEPIKPHLQMVNRAGLGSHTTDIRQLRKAGHDLMRRYIASDTVDVDLVFSSDFSKEERAILHQCAQKAGLVSKSYGTVDRFLVVKKKLDPFSVVRAVIAKGGCTPKYQVFLPATLQRR